MKHFLIAALFLFAFSVMATDTPETILPKTKEIRPISWYAGQSVSWKEKVEKASYDAVAWLNYYSASRYAQYSQRDLNNIASQASKAIPNTFEVKIIQALDGGFNKESFDFLKQAYAMHPDNASTYGSMVLFGEFNLSSAERLKFSKKLLVSGQVSQALLRYSYNVLMSVENNSILFVEGDNTTLPLFILQDVMNVRKDVKILNLDLLTSAYYREAKLKESGLNFFSDKMNGDNDQKKLLCSLIPEQNPGKKFYYALTMGRDNISSINNQLYVVGLASQISKERLDNISVIKDNLEKRFLLDYLLVDFNGESEFSAGKILSSNYLVPMLLLNDYYTKSGETAKVKQLEKFFTKIATENGKMELVDNFLNRENDSLGPIVLVDINIKYFDGAFKLIKDNLYAYQEEVTNGEYNLFLDYLKKHNPELLEKSNIDLRQYDATSLAFFKGYHTYINPVVKSRGRSNYYYKNYPIVNITHEGAVTYCEWLTEQYNSSPEKKFRKVKFRLPTLKEWQIAALGYHDFQSWDLYENKVKVLIPKTPSAEYFKGDETVVQVDNTILYPWFRSYNYKDKAQNSKNCWLGNFKIPEDCKPCMIRSIGGDGFSMMSSVGAYFPNDMGLYDVVGNVAEMIDEDGKACGGSWNLTPQESTIQSVSEYKGTSASVGFRVFMEVIQK